MTVLLIAVGGAIGALLRWMLSRSGGEIPWAIIAVNIVASGVAAALSEMDGSWRWLVNVGVLGALSTWSSLAVATVQLARSSGRVVAAGVVAGTAVASVAAAAVVLRLV